MGITKVTCTVRNPLKPKLSESKDFLVDSGASYTLIPKEMAKKLHIHPVFEKEFILADGTTMKRQIGNAYVTYNDIEVGTPVILGEEGDQPMLGIITLEGMGVLLDPFKRTLIPAKLRPC